MRSCTTQGCCVRHPRACPDTRRTAGSASGHASPPSPPPPPSNHTERQSACLHRGCAHAAACTVCGGEERVPNRLHFVWVGGGCPPRRALVSLIAAAAHLRPHAVHLWTRADSCRGGPVAACWHAFGAVHRRIPSWEDIAGCRPSLLPRPSLHHFPSPPSVHTPFFPTLYNFPTAPSALPTCAARSGFATPPSSMIPAHQSDIIRLHLLNTIGGVYLDSDAFVLRDLSSWRRCDFALGAEWGGPYPPKLNNGLLLARKGALFGQQWWRYLQSWDGAGWDDHSCGWPWRQCERTPHLVAATPRLGPLLPPKSFPAAEGAAVARNLSLLQWRDAVHLVAFRSWVHQSGAALWKIVEYVLRRAVLAASEAGGGGFNLQQHECVQRILSAGVSGLWESKGHANAEAARKKAGG
ncbi:hypothetical protein AB1Y20_006365 [Prymnesium parvum]|uniref:Alpha 1,4-glycosyltransferase domain-containing protein n=1 Tax=Prymnesium parvum TaxID=97485 RepID=A0AB34J3R3_PRYPA